MKTCCYRVLGIFLLAALLVGNLSGCMMIGGANKANPFWERAEAIQLSLLDYQAMSRAERMRVINTLTDIVYLDREDLALTRQAIDQEMMAGANTDIYDVGVLGSAFISFCYLIDESAETYLRRDEDQSVPLSEVVAMQVNDLTARLYSAGVGGMYALINGLHELGFIKGSAQSPEYFGPMLAMKVRAAVEDVKLEEDKTYTSSGKIDYQEEGGYLRELCKLLELDFDSAYPQLVELGRAWDEEKLLREAAEAAEAARRAESDRALVKTLVGDYFSASGWYLTLQADGSYALNSATEIALTFGDWEIENGVLVLNGDVFGAIIEDGFQIDGYEEPFVLY